MCVFSSFIYFQQLTVMRSYRKCILIILILVSFNKFTNGDVMDSVCDEISGDAIGSVLNATNEDPVDYLFDEIKCSCIRPSNMNVSQTKVLYHNYESNTQATYLINEAADKILARPDFDPELCINIFVTGFNNGTPLADLNCIFSQTTCNGRKTISMVIDHTYYTGNRTRLDTIELYKEVIIYVKPIGIAIGNFFLTLFQTLDINDRSINIGGHSIGAHMLGYAGEELITNNFILPILYGFDPAGPCFDDCPKEHFKSGQADIIISIHTNSGQLGTSLRVSDYNFISGDGVHQRGCGVGVASYPICSHVAAVPIGLNPVIRDNIWISKKCGSYEEYKKGLCDNNDSTLAGFTKVPDTEYGIYYFSPDDLVCSQFMI